MLFECLCKTRVLKGSQCKKPERYKCLIELYPKFSGKKTRSHWNLSSWAWLLEEAGEEAVDGWDGRIILEKFQCLNNLPNVNVFHSVYGLPGGKWKKLFGVENICKDSLLSKRYWKHDDCSSTSARTYVHVYVESIGVFVSLCVSMQERTHGITQVYIYLGQEKNGRKRRRRIYMYWKASRNKTSYINTIIIIVIIAAYT